ncbi:MAG TPA: hypothetical protein PK470_09575, partial [Candidatus Omnitrophota bacterium]|nr:hypothetical protein [Candidatus Omnitrophota bacterium]
MLSSRVFNLFNASLRSTLICFFTLILSYGSAHSATVIFQEGTNGVTDTEAASLVTGDPNYEDATKLYFRWDYPNVLYFPVAGHIPAGSTIDEATLEVYVYEEYNTSTTN